MLPIPARCPRRPAYMVGLCYPCPFEQHPTVRPWPHWLDTWRVLGFKALRVNAHHARPDMLAFLLEIAEDGLRPWPIIDITRPSSDGAASALVDRELPGVVRFTRELGQTFPWIDEVEVSNEPLSLGRLSPSNYARLCIAVGETMREANPACRIYIASEHLSSNGKTHDHWTETKRLVPLELYDGVAIHSYRGKADNSGFGTRRAEMARWREAVHPDKSFVCTETGYQVVPESEARQADELFKELEIQLELGITATFIYSHVAPDGGPDDFALFRDVGDAVIEPRASAKRVGEFFAAHKEITR